MLPWIRITELLAEVATWTQFPDCYTQAAGTVLSQIWPTNRLVYDCRQRFRRRAGDDRVQGQSF
jgi:hypothetical protein